MASPDHHVLCLREQATHLASATKWVMALSIRMNCLECQIDQLVKRKQLTVLILLNAESQTITEARNPIPTEYIHVHRCMYATHMCIYVYTHATLDFYIYANIYTYIYIYIHVLETRARG